MTFKRDIKRANALSRKKKLTASEKDELETLLRLHHEEYIYGVYRDDIHEYVDGAVYTANERASLEQQLDDEEEYYG
jgi:hypothetical protein